MDNRLRMYLAELIGTFMVVLVGAGTVCSTFLPGDRFAPVGGTTLAVALAEGCILAVALTFAFLVSTGCLNPAVTLTLWVLKRFEGRRAAGLIAVQLLGAVLAGLVVRVLFGSEVLADAAVGTPHLRALLDPNGAVTLAGWVTGIGLELLFTFIVTVAIFATLFDRRAPRLGGVVVGMAQTAVVLFGYHLTGGSANPARWFGPAVWQLTLDSAQTSRPLADHPVYWVGPILGALIGGIFYTAVIAPPEKR
jgi:glycerol uptake facilitator protein